MIPDPIKAAYYECHDQDRVRPKKADVNQVVHRSGAKNICADLSVLGDPAYRLRPVMSPKIVNSRSLQRFLMLFQITATGAY
jgi:hypothetical protein